MCVHTCLFVVLVNALLVPLGHTLMHNQFVVKYVVSPVLCGVQDREEAWQGPGSE